MNPLPSKISRAASSHPKLDGDAWQLFGEHFASFPWGSVPEGAIGFELGCGDGLWSSLVSQWAGELHAVEGRDGLVEEARQNLDGVEGCIHHASPLEELPFDDESMDFGYSIATLQQIENPQEVLTLAARKLKPGAPMMVYVLYALDNRPAWFRAIWQVSDLLRRSVASRPEPVRRRLTDGIASVVYLPLARIAASAERSGMSVENLPLSPYRNASIETMREAAWERFANQAERRFTRDELRSMMLEAGLDRIAFLEEPPYWTAVGTRSL